MNLFLGALSDALQRPGTVVIGQIAGSSGTKLRRPLKFLLVDLGGIEFVPFLNPRPDVPAPQQGTVAIRRAYPGEALGGAWRCRYNGHPLVLCTERDLQQPSNRLLLVPAAHPPGTVVDLRELLNSPGRQQPSEIDRIESLLAHAAQQRAHHEGRGLERYPHDKS